MTSNFQDTNPKKFYTKQQCTECGDCAEAFPRHLWPDLCEMVRNNVNSMHEQWQLAERAFSLGREDRPYKASLGRQALVGVKMTLNFFPDPCAILREFWERSRGRWCEDLQPVGL